ncbi:MAG: hypothetical protein KGO05_00275, partial [Chloroflexota bacterium]|nr:hypothetical protein [Chloroflexota bacterium]
MQKLRWRRGVWIGLAVALALLIAFEVGARLVTPDAVHYDIVVYNYGVSQPITTTTFTTTGTYTSPAIVAMWRAAM